MNFGAFLMVVEAFVFWTLVAIIAWRGANAPWWTFAFLFYYLIYLVLRFVLAKQGIDRMIYLNIVNIVVILALFVYFQRNS